MSEEINGLGSSEIRVPLRWRRRTSAHVRVFGRRVQIERQAGGAGLEVFSGESRALLQCKLPSVSAPA